MSKKYLAIFDLDGTLFNTDDVNYYAYKEALSLYDVDLDRDFFLSECMGKPYTEFLPGLLSDEDAIEDVHRNKKVFYANYLGKAIKNNHLFRIIEGLRDEYYISIVTTASKKNTNDILNYFAVADFFDLVITQEDMINKKPDPEGFLMAMNHYNVSTENTIIFEDSDIGIEAARASKANVCVIDRIK